MRKWNFGKRQRLAIFLKLCICILISATLALGGMAASTSPVHALPISIVDPGAITMTECTSFTLTFEIAAGSCACCTGFKFYLLGTVPDWIHLDQDTGELTAVPPAGSAGVIPTFQVICSEEDPSVPCGLNWSAPLDINITVDPGAPPCPLVINPTFYPVAWEGLPFSMTLSSTGGLGPINWVAADLPAGLAVSDNVAGIISGIPAFGTCGPHTVTVTAIDTGGCCAAVSATFILFVDCWANYPPFFYYTTACDFTVEIGPGLTQGYTNVIIDGKHEATLVGGQSETFISVPCESHLVMVDQYIQPDANTKFAVIGSNVKNVTDVDNYAYFDYGREVYIGTGSNPSGATQPPGAGFYTVGGTFTSTVPGTIETDIQNGIKLVFDEWGLPDGTTRPVRDLAFIVNQGGTVVAEYDTYYQLTLHSDYPAITERSWEIANSTATWDLSLHAVPVESGFWRFLGVTQTPVNASGSQLITGPTTVEILWRPNYLPAIIAIVITLLVIAGVIYLIYRLRSKPAAKPAARTRAKKTPPVTKKRVTKKTPPGTKKRVTKKRASK